MAEDQLTRAKRLREGTKRLRFFRGQMYDTDADDYLLELHKFLDEFIAAVSSNVNSKEKS